MFHPAQNSSVWLGLTSKEQLIVIMITTTILIIIRLSFDFFGFLYLILLYFGFNCLFQRRMPTNA